jgi:serine/threonine-protein kinase RIO1
VFESKYEKEAHRLNFQGSREAAIVKFRTKSGETIAIKAYRTFTKRSRTMKPQVVHLKGNTLH